MLKIKDNVDLNIFIKEYDFKPEYDKDTGQLIELYRIKLLFRRKRKKKINNHYKRGKLCV